MTLKEVEAKVEKKFGMYDLTEIIDSGAVEYVFNLISEDNKRICLLFGKDMEECTKDELRNEIVRLNSLVYGG